MQVEWEGHNQIGEPWPDSWHSVVCLRRLTAEEAAAGEADLYGKARAMELERYGGGGGGDKRAAEGDAPDRSGRRRPRLHGEYAE